MTDNYTVSDKVRYVIANDYRLLQVMGRFDISLGFGERTIYDVCTQKNIDPQTFVTVINFVKDGGHQKPKHIEDISVPALLAYLRKTHSYFLDYLFPNIRRNLLNAIDCSVKNEVAFVMLKFYDEYVEEVRKHMSYEESVTFAYVETLLESAPVSAASDTLHTLSTHHDSIDKKLMELKNLFVQYYPQKETSNELNSVLYDLYHAQEDLSLHSLVEDYIFLPAVRLLEKKRIRAVPENSINSNIVVPANTADELSAREKEIVVLVSKGLANKEIAERLCLSVNTVTTHRRNIARKLSIHSSAGITIYAIVNKLVSLDEVHL